MLHLRNDQLAVEILDPVADRDKLGTRFCAGGQIFQVTDHRHGPLLSGPTYPDSYNTFDSQGLPDGFTIYPGLEEHVIGDRVMAIGVGLARYTHAVGDIFPRTNREVAAWLDWRLQEIPGGMRFEADHDYDGFGYRMGRDITLENRRIRVATTLQGTGARDLPVQWFAHPFYPFPKNGIAGDIPSDFEPNEAFGRGGNGHMILRCTPDKGPLDPFRTFMDGRPTPPADGPLVIRVNHDRIGAAGVVCEFSVDRLPCWYNHQTFSPEPYLTTTLKQGERVDWAIMYAF